MKTVLITGYTGFVGTNLVPYLQKKGFNIVGAGRQKVNGADFEQFGYNELAKIKNYDALIHLAGKAHDLKKTSDDALYFEVNTNLTIQVFKQFLQSPATDFIYLSSVKAAADTVKGILLETDIPGPVTAYGQSKLKAEEYLLNAVLPEGKRVFILRPCMIHGPGNKGNLNLLYQMVKRRIPYPLAAFKNSRSLLSVDNLLFVIQNLLQNKDIRGGIYNVADDEPLATTEIIDVLGKALKIKPLQWPIPASFIKAVALAGDKLHLPLTTERLQKLSESYVVSNKKIKQATGLTNLPVNARDGLLNTALNL